MTTTTNYTFNDANRMTNAGAQAYTVDANGNLTNDGRYQYTWNAFDQLTSVKGATDTAYTYDENGRRVYSKVGVIETYYRYDKETKLYYLMARYYNPNTGVFLSLEPVRGDTMNPDGYFSFWILMKFIQGGVLNSWDIVWNFYKK